MARKRYFEKPTEPTNKQLASWKAKQRKKLMMTKTQLYTLMMNVYSIGKDLLTIPDGVRGSRNEFNIYILRMCSRIASYCQDICAIEERL